MSAEPRLKRCGKCREEKPRYHFPRRRRSPDGLHAWCRACLKTYNAGVAVRGAVRL